MDGDFFKDRFMIGDFVVAINKLALRHLPIIFVLIDEPEDELFQKLVEKALVQGQRLLVKVLFADHRPCMVVDDAVSLIVLQVKEWCRVGIGLREDVVVVHGPFTVFADLDPRRRAPGVPVLVDEMACQRQNKHHCHKAAYYERC